MSTFLRTHQKLYECVPSVGTSEIEWCVKFDAFLGIIDNLGWACVRVIESELDYSVFVASECEKGRVRELTAELQAHEYKTATLEQGREGGSVWQGPINLA